MLIIKQKDKIVKILAFLFILSLFFPVRHIFFSKEAYLIGQYSDFTSFSLYLSDILLIGLFILLLMSRGKALYHVVRPFRWLVLVLLFSFLINLANFKLGAYLSLKLIELIVAYGTLRLVFEENSLKTGFLKLFAWLCGLESVIGLLQFSKQSPIGFFKLGEQHIGPSILGVAKIVSDGTNYIRAYGTFPHPNPMSAFLVVGVLVTCYLLLNSNTLKTRICYSLLLFLNILGLTITFSRGAYLALGIGLKVYLGLLLWRRYKTKFKGSLASLWMTIGVIVASIVISFVLFKPFLLTRATFSDQSTIARKFYDVVGLKMIQKNPLLGVGIGESILNMEKYSGQSLQPWDKQPPHNYFIIAGAELGIPAMLIVLWIFLSHLWELFKKIKFENHFQLTTSHLLLISILCAFLVLMQFDHYFYTLEQTRLLLWVVLALIASEALPTIDKTQ